MTEEQLAALREEQRLGVKAKSAYGLYVKQFVEESKEVLFEAFQEISITNPEQLLEVKRQLMAIEALDSKINVAIEAGKLASKQLGVIDEQ